MANASSGSTQPCQKFLCNRRWHEERFLFSKSSMQNENPPAAILPSPVGNMKPSVDSCFVHSTLLNSVMLPVEKHSVVVSNAPACGGSGCSCVSALPLRTAIFSPRSIPQNIQLHATRLPVARSDCGYRVLSVWGLDLNHRGSGLGLRVLIIRHRSARMVHFIPDHTFAHITPPPSEINCPGQRFKRVVCIISTQS